MDKVQIIWGDLDRTEAIEAEVFGRAEKILERAPQATNLIVNLKVINSLKSAGVPTQGVLMELRLPNHQDVRAEKQGDDLYKTIKDTQQALLSQISN